VELKTEPHWISGRPLACEEKAVRKQSLRQYQGEAFASGPPPGYLPRRGGECSRAWKMAGL